MIVLFSELSAMLPTRDRKEFSAMASTNTNQSIIDRVLKKQSLIEKKELSNLTEITAEQISSSRTFYTNPPASKSLSEPHEIKSTLYIQLHLKLHTDHGWIKSKQSTIAF